MAQKNEEKLFRVAVGAEPADRPISPLRADLKISPQLFYGQLCFVIKDPVTLRYFRLQPTEHFLATQLDGRRTARDLLGLLQQQFPDSPASLSEVLRFIGMLHEAHLLLGEGVAHAQWLAKRGQTSRRRRLLAFFQNFLFLKLPLFNPDQLLTRMHEWIGRFIFHPLAGIAALALILFSLARVLASTDRLANLPYNLLSLENLTIMYCVFVVTKVFHEFGHGLTTKHHGGEVSNMGVMLFVFTPSFYCDTSDAWMIPSRAARLWINAAGIVVELVLAALAGIVWVYTQDTSLINQIALNVMISCSIATLIFNANPLLKYDGYYFLADLLEIPNLSTKGRDFLKYYGQKYILDVEAVMPPDHARLAPLMLYAVLSGIYRWIVAFAIITLLCYFFDQYGMGPIGLLLAVGFVLATILLPAARSVQYLWQQRWEMSRRLTYIGGAAGATVAILVLVAMLPWSHTIREPMVVVSEQDKPIFVSTPGYVETVEADMGDFVKAGQVILRMKDPSLQNLREQAVSKRDAALIAVANARADKNPAGVAAAQTAVDAYNKRIELLTQRTDDLVIRAPIDGIVVRDASLRRIVGNYVPPGLRLCRIIQTEHLQARISLPQQTAALVKPGMTVRMRLWSDPDAQIFAKISRVSANMTDQLDHPALASTVKGDVTVTADPKGQIKSLGRRATVIIDLPAQAPQTQFLADGMTGRAEIIVRRTTIFGRVWRMILDSTTPDWHL